MSRRNQIFTCERVVALLGYPRKVRAWPRYKRSIWGAGLVWAALLQRRVALSHLCARMPVTRSMLASNARGMSSSARRRCRQRGAPHRRFFVLLALCVMVQVALVSRALADGTATAGDSGDTVTVGASNSSSEPGAPGHPRPIGSGQRGPVCSYTLLPATDQAALGSGPGPGSWYELDCAGPTLGLYPGGVVWVAAPSATPASVAPSSLLAQAVRSLVVPAPSIRFDPSAFTVVNIATWLWIDPAHWRSYTATASAGGVSATAVATPVDVVWQTGDGSGGVVCPGPGVPYRTAVPPSAQRTYCSYTFRRSSAGQVSSDGDANDGAFPVTATITWSITWTASGAPGGGVLPPLHTSSSSALRVEQVESVGTAP